MQVVLDLGKAGLAPTQLEQAAAAFEPSIRIKAPRLVFHYQLEEQAVRDLVAVVAGLLKKS